MKPLVRALLLAALAAPVRAGPTSVDASVDVHPIGTGAQSIAAPALTSPALSLAPSLSPTATLAPSLAAPTPLVAPGVNLVPSLSAAPSAAPAAVPLAAALPAPGALPAAAIPERGAAKDAPALEKAAHPAAFDGGAPADAEAETLGGRALFDLAAPERGGSVWQKFKDWAKIGDKFPTWPGEKGQVVRAGKRELILTEVAGDGGGSRVWRTNIREYVVKIVHPQFMALPHYSDEASILRAIKNSDIPHAKLLAASPDGSVMIKEFLEGDDARVLLRRGFEDRHLTGWAELAAKLIRAGVTADLVPSNLIYQHWRSRWALADAGGIEDAGPAKVLEQLLTPESEKAGVEPARFLADLRGRLGPDSAEWAKTVAALNASPKLAAARDALAARDAVVPAAPKVSFRSGAPGPYPDRVVSPAEIRKTLGYDPLFVKERLMLHADDPGKLNTQVFEVKQPGKPTVVVKIAGWHIVRNELAMRRVVRRFFGEGFSSPSAFGVNAKHDSYLVMEKVEGSASFAVGRMDLKRRVALGIMARAFGLFDMNRGNVLFGPHDEPHLIDFEQALSRSGPVASRLPDEGIAWEMPWMSLSTMNRIEDYQPAIREWRALLAKPETQAELRADFVASGFTNDEATELLARVNANSGDLDWTLQSDADFVNQFVKRKTGAVAP